MFLGILKSYQQSDLGSSLGKGAKLLELMLKSFKACIDLGLKRAGMQPEWPFNIHHMFSVFIFLLLLGSVISEKSTERKTPKWKL